MQCLKGESNRNLFSKYGISGPYWYAGGATIQIILFSILSIMLKTRAPGAKTFLQVSPLSARLHSQPPWPKRMTLTRNVVRP